MMKLSKSDAKHLLKEAIKDEIKEIDDKMAELKKDKEKLQAKISLLETRI